MLITCPECSHSVSDKAISCPNCGYPIKLPLEQEKPLKRANTQPRRSKHPKLPNGTGSIKYQKNVKRKPYYAYPPCKKLTVNGVPVLDKPIGSFETWYDAYEALLQWKNGSTYSPAVQAGRNNNYTFKEIYEMYYKEKYESGGRQYSKSTINADKAAFRNAAALHERIFAGLVKSDLQGVIDKCGERLKHASLELIVNLYHQMYDYAIGKRLVDIDMAALVKISTPDDDERGVPFSEHELMILWQNRQRDDVQMILLMIYSGFRIKAYENLEINLTEEYFKGGVKTAAGKMRTVPIHYAVLDYAKKLRDKKYRFCSKSKNITPAFFRKNIFYPCLESLGILTAESGEKHTPHDTRHTFSWLCDRDGVDDLSKHLLMGHAVTGDVEKSKYGHRTLEELRAEINKIKVPGAEILANR